MYSISATGDIYFCTVFHLLITSLSCTRRDHYQQPKFGSKSLLSAYSKAYRQLVFPLFRPLTGRCDLFASFSRALELMLGLTSTIMALHDKVFWLASYQAFSLFDHNTFNLRQTYVKHDSKMRDLSTPTCCALYNI